MANYFTEHRLVDTNHRTVIKLCGVFDAATAVANVLAIDVSTLRFSLNTNGYVMTGNTDARTNYRTSVISIKAMHNIANGFISLAYLGTGAVSNSEIATLPAGYTFFDLTDAAKGAAIYNPIPVANTTGDIVMTIKGAQGNSAYTILVELKKDGNDYDQGRQTDPYGLRRGFDIVAAGDVGR
jgi:hypothetical protein